MIQVPMPLCTDINPFGSLWSRLDDVDAAHPRTQNFGDDDGAIGLLVIFHHGDESTRQSQTGSIQRMRELDLAAIGWAILDIGAASLEIGVI